MALECSAQLSANSIVFLQTYACIEQLKRMKHGKKDTVMNYTKHLMNQTLSIISKLQDWHGQGT
jgi:hypothetical protein